MLAYFVTLVPALVKVREASESGIQGVRLLIQPAPRPGLEPGLGVNSGIGLRKLKLTCDFTGGWQRCSPNRLRPANHI